MPRRLETTALAAGAKGVKEVARRGDTLLRLAITGL